MPTDPKPGEVWFAELGMVEKSRPVLVLAFPGSEDAGSLAIVAPLTSQIRGLRGEVVLLSLFHDGESYGRAIARDFAVSLDAVQRQLDRFEKSVQWESRISEGIEQLLEIPDLERAIIRSREKPAPVRAE